MGWEHTGSYSSIWWDDSIALCSMQDPVSLGKPRSHAMEDMGNEENEKLFACAARSGGR